MLVLGRHCIYSPTIQQKFIKKKWIQFSHVAPSLVLHNLPDKALGVICKEWEHLISFIILETKGAFSLWHSLRWNGWWLLQTGVRQSWLPAPGSLLQILSLPLVPCWVFLALFKHMCLRPIGGSSLFSAPVSYPPHFCAVTLLISHLQFFSCLPKVFPESSEVMHLSFSCAGSEALICVTN